VCPQPSPVPAPQAAEPKPEKRFLQKDDLTPEFWESLYRYQNQQQQSQASNPGPCPYCGNRDPIHNPAFCSVRPEVFLRAGVPPPPRNWACPFCESRNAWDRDQCSCGRSRTQPWGQNSPPAFDFGAEGQWPSDGPSRVLPTPGPESTGGDDSCWVVLKDWYADRGIYLSSTGIQAQARIKSQNWPPSSEAEKSCCFECVNLKEAVVHFFADNARCGQFVLRK
jgi:hypothetical protein